MTERSAATDDGRVFPVRPRGWGVAVTVGCILAQTAIAVHLVGVGPVDVPLLVFLALALLVDVLAGLAWLRAAASERRRREADALAVRHVALRRVATMVARGGDPVEVYGVSVDEVAHGLGVQHVTLVQFDAGPSCTVLAAHPDVATMYVGGRLPLDGDSVASRIRHSGAPARIDDHTDVGGPVTALVDGLGLRSGVGAPVTVDGQPRGALLVGSDRPGALPHDAQEWVGDVADLIATAIATAEAQAERTASRTRLVAAADRARRGFEVDLRDGVQQRIAALGLGLRTIEASVSTDQQAVRLQLDNVINGMADLYKDVQELSRGIYPAHLAKDGLGTALRALARRSTIPVSIEVDVDERLPESTEVTAYDVVAEGLANAGKHSRASRVVIRVGLGSDGLVVTVSDDGVGGATSADGGSGLIGLRDRVEAVSGRLDVLSPHDGGTTVTARIPHVRHG